MTGANVGTLKADAADKDGVELTLKGETLNKKEATVKADGKVEVTTTFADAATAGALAGANFGETTTTVENVTEDFDLKIVSVKVGDKDVLSKKAVYGEYADSKNIATTSVGDFEKFTAEKGDEITFTYKVNGVTDLDALKKENEALAASKAALEKENGSLAASKAALEKDNASLVASKAALEKDNKSLAASKAALETENKALAASNSALVASKAALEKDNKSLAASKAALEDQLKNTPAPTETPAPVAKGQMGNFNVSFDYVGDDTYGEQSWGDKSVNVTKDGDYSIEYTATSDSKGIYLMMLDTDLYYGSLADNFALTVTIKVTVAKTANVKKKKAANYTVALAKVTKKIKAKKIKVSVKNKKVAKVTVKKTAKGQVTFQVKGLKKGKTTATLKYGKKSAKVSVVVK